MALAKSQQSLKNWGDQKWRTSDKKPSKGKRDTYQMQRGTLYLPVRRLQLIKPKLKVIKKVSNLLNNQSQ